MRASTNVNDEDLLTGLANVIIKHVKKKMQNCLPVKVVSVSADRKFVNVQPQIMIVDTDKNTTPRAEIKGIPIETSGAGGFLISFNIKAGDLGWINASDRDISLFKQSYGEAKPNTERMHDFGDSRFVPDIMTNFTIAGEDEGAVVIQNRAGNVKIAMDEEEIRITKDSITLVLSGDTITGVAPGGFNLNNFTIDASGAAASPVSITAPSAMIGGKELAEHTHAAGTYKIGTSPVTENSGVNNP